MAFNYELRAVNPHWEAVHSLSIAQKCNTTMEEILQRLNTIERNTLLAAKNVLTFDDVVLLTGLSKSHLYKLTARKEIPYYRKGKYIYFDRAEVEAWMKENRVETKTESQQRAAAYVVGKEA